MHELLRTLCLTEDEDFDLIFANVSLLMEETLLLHKDTSTPKKPTVVEANRQFIVYDFPASYIESLEFLLYPDWYVACFLQSYNNSSLWANYGDQHRGSCLILATDDTADEDSISLKRITGYSNKGPDWRYSPMKFYDVTYSAERSEIDFFRSLGRLPQKKAMEVWYTGDDGMVSESCSGIEKNIDAWREEYWTRYYPSITAKNSRLGI